MGMECKCRTGLSDSSGKISDAANSVYWNVLANEETSNSRMAVVHAMSYTKVQPIGDVAPHYLQAGMVEG